MSRHRTCARRAFQKWKIYLQVVHINIHTFMSTAWFTFTGHMPIERSTMHGTRLSILKVET